ncbi:MAG: beta-N-acetylhexosaminidase [Eubacteriales bacterium]
MGQFETLGVMIDCSRNAVMKPSALKDFIDKLANMGYNSLQLYTEDTYEVPKEPYFGYLRGRYSQAEIREMDAHCRQRGIELIPCIQTLAHLNGLVRWDPYRAIFDCHDILLVEEERTYELIDHMIASLAECYTSRRVHIGMDEAFMLGLGKYRKLHGHTDRLTLMLRHLSRVCEICERYGFTPMMWHDMFFKLISDTDEEAGIELVRKLKPKSLDLVYWDYYSTSVANYETKIRRNQAMSDNVWFAGGAWAWMGFAPYNHYSMETTRAAFEACRSNGVKHAFLTIWGDDGHECPKCAVLPALAYAAALAENPDVTEAELREKFAAWTGENYDDCLSLDLPNRPGDGPFKIETPSKYLFYNDPLLGIFDSTVSPTDAAFYEGLAGHFTALTDKGGAFAYMYRASACLCRFLSLKADLGVRTRAAYQAKEKPKLAALLPVYDRALEALEAFLTAFRTQWFTENKPHGFDVQELRIGGLKERLRSARARLSEYLDGACEGIPELEETLLPANTQKAPGQPIQFNRWAQNATVNVISHNQMLIF